MAVFLLHDGSAVAEDLSQLQLCSQSEILQANHDPIGMCNRHDEQLVL